MKKNGYTLAEVLIALGLVGVIAAVCLPLVNKYRPDISKVRYLKAYDMIADTVNQLSANTAIYPKVVDGDIYDYALIPFFNTCDITLTSGDKIRGGNNKFARAFAYAIDTKMLNDPDTYTDAPNFSKPSFVLDKNNMAFFITSQKTQSGLTGTYKTDIYFDIDGTAEGPNCMFDKAAGCTAPDRFKLTVGADGTIYVADALGEEYLTKRSNWKKTKYDADTLLGAVLDANVTLRERVGGGKYQSDGGDGGGIGGGGTEEAPPPPPEVPIAFTGHKKIEAGWVTDIGQLNRITLYLIEAWLNQQASYMYGLGCNQNKVIIAKNATLSFYQDLIWNRISSAGKKTTHDGVQTSVNYSIVGYNGYNTGSGNYWSGVQTYHTSCWYREATATDVVNASMANTSVSNTTGVYYSVSYAKDDTRKIWVDTNKVADIFTMMYNQISK